MDLRHFFLTCGFFKNCGRTCFQFFPPPDLRRKSAGMRRKSAGMRRKFREANGVAAFLFCLRRFFWCAADFLECGGNFRRNALRQKFPPQEVLGMCYVCLSFHCQVPLWDPLPARVFRATLFVGLRFLATRNREAGSNRVPNVGPCTNPHLDG